MKRPARKAIPRAVKDKVLARQHSRCAACGRPFEQGDKIEYDHRPAIVMRAVNVEGTDYHPPQNDPEHIDALHKACHLRRTVGRLPGAEKTATTKGSDAWLAAKFRKLEGKNKPKRKQSIPSRPFSKRIKR
jgi:5-methylcytosine-specific restriction endonuclease McrA